MSFAMPNFLAIRIISFDQTVRAVKQMPSPGDIGKVYGSYCATSKIPEDGAQSQTSGRPVAKGARGNRNAGIRHGQVVGQHIKHLI
jgi:hypothetical protein